MSTPKILRAFRDRWDGWLAARMVVMEPLDHPSLKGMSWRELADLPLERARCGESSTGIAACPAACGQKRD